MELGPFANYVPKFLYHHVAFFVLDLSSGLFLSGSRRNWPAAIWKGMLCNDGKDEV